ncbi:MAG TPA: hypothetical protein VH307_11120 [Streptosporangiaceae bacterium]|nr:hypothetical protein [Streptosporangiaceae bacterium]
MAALAGIVDAVAGAGVALAPGAVGAGAACEAAEQPAAARHTEAMAAAAQMAERREAAPLRPLLLTRPAASSQGAITRGELAVFLALFMSAPWSRRGLP